MATIYGTNVADELYDSAGDDRIYGYGGNDLIYGWAGGNDVIAARAGNDTVDIDGGPRSKIFGNDGNDRISNFADADENGGGGWIYGGNSNDAINGNGYLSGDAGNDVLHGGWDAANTILGGTGNDQLDGNGTLNGGSGRDTLSNNIYGGIATKMTGGTQADTFRIDLDDGSYSNKIKVTITDFRAGEGDKLQLTSVHLNGESPYFGYYSDNPYDLFDIFDADAKGRFDGVIRIGDFSTSKSADGDLQLRYFGSMVELDGVRSISTVDWIH